MRELWSVVLLGGLTTVALVSPLSCSEPPTSIDARAYISQVGDAVIVPALQSARADAQILRDTLVEDALGEESQQAFRAAMASWQRAEAVQFGPMASTGPNAQTLRDRIYSWPTVSPCSIDEWMTVQDTFGSADIENALVNVVGLDAIEHLLFGADTHSCDAELDEAWDALSASERDARRAALAELLASDIVQTIDVALDAWSGDVGAAFRDGVVNDEQALQALYEAMFYLEIMTKDRKLLPVVGTGCDEGICSDAGEGVLSGTGATAIRENVEGVVQLYEAGMDDVLRELRHRELASVTADAMQRAREATAFMEGDLTALAQAEPERIDGAIEAIRAVTDLLKLDLAAVLSLDVPREVVGDVD